MHNDPKEFNFIFFENLPKLYVPHTEKNEVQHFKNKLFY